MNNYLSKAGYLALSLPRQSVKPMDILIRNGSNTIEFTDTTADEIFDSTKSTPLPDNDKQIPDELVGEELIRLDTSFGVKFLDGFARLFGAKGAALSGDFSSNDSVKFNFDGGLLGEVNLSQLDQFISAARVKEGLNMFSENISNSKVYIVTSVLKSRKFSIELTRSAADKVNVNTGDVKGVASAETSFDRDSNKSNRMDYTGDNYLVFAIRAVQLIYDKPSWWNFSSKAIFKLRNTDTNMVVRGGNDKGYTFLDDGDTSS